MKALTRWIGVGLLAAVFNVQATDESVFERAPWTVSGGITYLGFEGDEVVESGTAFTLKFGYTLNPRWDIEAGIEWAPSLDNTEFNDERYSLDGSTWLFRFPVDFLYHLRNTTDLHWDPYLSVGGGLTVGEESFGDSQADLYVSGGGGLAYHFNDEWALRGEARGLQSFQQHEFGWEAGLAVNWRWGARSTPDFQLAGGELDSDGEGLSDEFEKTIGTDPFKPDTDGDGLTDFEEVRTFQTDPLNPDSDYDGLSDGAEVHTYQTNPLKADTDDGGVADGHEVIEDGTNPLEPSDDLQLFTLNIEFDYNKADLRPSDFDELDIVAKVLQRNPNATARIEGHADKRKKSSRDYNLKLSQRRAEAVLAYLADVGGIQRSRMSAHGYGFDRALAPNDTEANMQKNRRTEIYIRKDGVEPSAP